ncbi:MAG: B12-binding domain-containing radical SAM protein [Candidatus Magnetoovum sp. WYHC-5]|nr:B12-binding domain-containing radical SAM protein [Candidatus Magnetoovum sp. WYHC-5]
MSNVLLINPPPYVSNSYSRYLEKTPVKTYTMPLGIGYIASTLEKYGHRLRILDAYVKGYDFNQIEAYIREVAPDVIGIQCLSDQRASWYRLVGLIRAIDDKIKIVLGGPHPSILPAQVLQHCRPDALVIGEGEDTMVSLLEAWQRGSSLNSVDGIAYNNGSNVVVTAPRQRIQALDALPYPAYHLVDMDDYAGWDFIKTIYRLLGCKDVPKYATMSTSRGCVSACGYCSAPLIWKRKWTRRGYKSVVDEMEMLQKDYGVQFIIITDDIFTVDEDRVKAICEEILRRGLDIQWGFETAVNFVSPEMLLIAKKAGCICILYGVESASEEVLSFVQKKVRRADVINAFLWTKRAGILAGAFLMAGNPGETERTIDSTISLLKQINPDIVLPQITMIAPGTRIFERAKEKGCIDEAYWLGDKPFPYYTCERGLKTLLRWYRKLHYFNKSYTVGQLLSFRDFIELHTGFRVAGGKIFKV